MARLLFTYLLKNAYVNDLDRFPAKIKNIRAQTVLFGLFYQVLIKNF